MASEPTSPGDPGGAAASADAGVSGGTLAMYALPLTGCLYLAFLLSTYWFKYATEVLLVPPAVLSAIFMVGRIWDAVADPLTGYLSDRTRTRWGRRRPWLVAAALPVAASPVLIWAPPAGLDGAALVIWLTVGLLLFETAMTMVFVPHGALGTELVLDHHGRTRVFTYREILSRPGLLAAIIATGLIIEAEDPRAMAARVVAVGAAVTALMLLLAAARLRERPEFQGRGSPRPLPALADVWKNPHARLLLSVFLIESMGVGTLGILGPFIAKYIVGDESVFPYQVGAYLVPSLAAAAAAPALSRRVGKKRLWLISMVIAGGGFGMLTFVGPGDVAYLLLCSIPAGIGTGIGQVVGPSLQADIVDYDEHRTGERKEGIYYATWNFMRKAGGALVVFLTGLALTAIGFEANAPAQSPLTERGMLLLFGAVPCAGFAIGVTLFARFRFSEADHRRIRQELDRRASAALGK